MFKSLLAIAISLILLTGCVTPPQKVTATPQVTPPTTAPVAVTTTQAWPRQVTDAEGKLIEIKQKPVRIHTLSVGYDEITMRLVGPERFAAVGSVSANPLYSNIHEQANLVPLKVGRKSEDVIAARPDLVVASPFANKDLVQQLKDAGITVVISSLNDSLDGHAQNIRFLAHLYGEEEQGEALVQEVTGRLSNIDVILGHKPMAERPRVISLTEKLNTPGMNTTMGGIIERAGGINVAAEAGIERWQVITLEKVVELQPEVILVAPAKAGKPDFGMELLQHPSLQNVPAIKAQRIYAVPTQWTSTLSHYNVRGVEELAKLLWPEEFKHVTFDDFK